jgi:hypothetical protein
MSQKWVCLFQGQGEKLADDHNLREKKMSTLLTTVLSGVFENNDNGGNWSDWDDAAHVLEVYGENYTGETSKDEMVATVAALDSLIESNGKSWTEAIDDWNMAVWGKKFADNNGSTPYSG